MTTRKSNGVVNSDEWTISLPSQADLVKESMQAYNAAASRQRPLSKGEERVAAEGNKQLSVIAYEGMKICNAVQENGKVHELAAELMSELGAQHDEYIEAAAGKTHQNVLKQYGLKDLETSARQNQKFSEVAHQKFVEVIVRPVYKDDEPEVVIKEVPQKGFFNKLFG